MPASRSDPAVPDGPAAQRGAVATLEAKPLPAPRDADGASWSAYFEGLYRRAEGVPERVPWADAGPCPALVSWLNAEAPGLVRPGATVTVVGCGLGHDAAELAGRGYDVVGFDCAPTAVDWARREHPELADRLIVADLLDVPAHLRRRADLVVEVYTLQSVAPGLRPAMARAVCGLARPRGLVVTICRGRGEDEPLGAQVGPPFAFTAGELASLMAAEGFCPLRAVDDFMDDEDPPKRRLRGVFRRG